MQALETRQMLGQRSRHICALNQQQPGNQLSHWVEDKSLRECEAEYCNTIPPPKSTIALAFSPDGRLLATTHGDHTVKITCCFTRKCIRTFSQHTRTPWVVRFHPKNSDMVASGSLDGFVRIFSIQTGECIKAYHYVKQLSSLAFSPDGSELAVSAGHKVYIWRYTTSQAPKVILKTKRTLRGLHFHPTQPLLLTAELMGQRAAPERPPESRPAAMLDSPFAPPSQLTERLSNWLHQFRHEVTGPPDLGLQNLTLQDQATLNQNRSEPMPQASTSRSQHQARQNVRVQNLDTVERSLRSEHPRADRLTSSYDRNSNVQQRAPISNAGDQQCSFEASSIQHHQPVNDQAANREHANEVATNNLDINDHVKRFRMERQANEHSGQRQNESKAALGERHSYPSSVRDPAGTRCSVHQRQFAEGKDALPASGKRHKDKLHHSHKSDNWDWVCAIKDDQAASDLQAGKSLLETQNMDAWASLFGAAHCSQPEGAGPTERSPSQAQGSQGPASQNLSRLRGSGNAEKPQRFAAELVASQPHPQKRTSDHGPSRTREEKRQLESKTLLSRELQELPQKGSRDPVSSRRAERNPYEGLREQPAEDKEASERPSCSRQSRVVREGRIETAHKDAPNRSAEGPTSTRPARLAERNLRVHNERLRTAEASERCSEGNAERDRSESHRRHSRHSSRSSQGLTPKEYVVEKLSRPSRALLSSSGSISSNSHLQQDGIHAGSARFTRGIVSTLPLEGTTPPQMRRTRSEEDLAADRSRRQAERAARRQSRRSGNILRSQDLLRSQDILSSVDDHRSIAAQAAEEATRPMSRRSSQMVMALNDGGNAHESLDPVDGNNDPRFSEELSTRSRGPLLHERAALEYTADIVSRSHLSAAIERQHEVIQALTGNMDRLEAPNPALVRIWKYSSSQSRKTQVIAPCPFSGNFPSQESAAQSRSEASLSHESKAACEPQPLTSELLQFQVTNAVLCSEMGAHFSPCGRMLVLCVACQDNNSEQRSGEYVARHRYELRLYSMEPHNFGKPLKSRIVKAPQCLTSIQFSPTSRYLIVAYGRRHISLLQSMTHGEDSVLRPVHTVMEIWKTSDMSLLRVLPESTDEINTAAWNPVPGFGLAYGTKEGCVRMLAHPACSFQTSFAKKGPVEANEVLSEEVSDIEAFPIVP